MDFCPTSKKPLRNGACSSPCVVAPTNQLPAQSSTRDVLGKAPPAVLDEGEPLTLICLTRIRPVPLSEDRVKMKSATDEGSRLKASTHLVQAATKEVPARDRQHTLNGMCRGETVLVYILFSPDEPGKAAHLLSQDDRQSVAHNNNTSVN